MSAAQFVTASQSVAVDCHTVIANLDRDAALAFLVIQIADHDQAQSQHNDHHIQGAAVHVKAVDGGQVALFATQRILKPADNILRLAFDLVGLAVRDHLRITKRFPNRLLDLTFGSFHSADDTIFVHFDLSLKWGH